MIKMASWVGTVLLLGAVTTGASAQSGETVFQTKCAACHTVGSDRLVGPGLAGVLARRDRAWVRRFIVEPDRVLASGDSIAAALLREYVVPMPNLAVSDAEAEALLTYLATAEAPPAESVPPPDAAPTEQQVVLGQELFQGTTRFANGGPTCNACHEVTNDAVIGGGLLAAELTTVFSRLGGPGVRAILGSPPFPVMQRAYAGKPLTDDEVTALVGFLQQADEQHLLHQPRDYGPKLFAAGVLGTVFLLGLYTLLWRGRARGSVNQAIYDRQIKSI